MRTLRSKAKRSAMVAVATVAALVASLFVASPAFAYSERCNYFSSGALTWQVCVLQVGATGARARVTVGGSGTYISGTLYLLAPDDLAHNTGCSGRIYPGTTCIGPNTYAGYGGYEAEWYSRSGPIYRSPIIYI